MRTFYINKRLGLHMNFHYINLVLRRILKARMYNSPLKSSKLIYAFLIQKTTYWKAIKASQNFKLKHIQEKAVFKSKTFNKLSSFQRISKKFINDLNIPTWPTFLLYIGSSTLQDSFAVI